MVRIRLTRVGRRNAPAYRIIVIDSHKKRDGKYIEKLGNYNPTEHETNINYDKERYEYWISKGAQPSLAIRKLVDGKYVYKPYNKGKVEEEAPAETPEVATGTESVEATNTEEAVVETAAEPDAVTEVVEETPAAEEPAKTDTDTEESK